MFSLNPSPRVADDSGPAIEARSVDRFFWIDDEQAVALRDVSLQVWPGQVVVIAGPAGSGKSTLLACLAGLDEPSGGAVHVNGKRMSQQPADLQARLRARHIGVLFPAGNLFPHLTVAQNIGLAQGFTGVRFHRHRRNRQFNRELLTRLGLAGQARDRPGHLSGGEAVRAGLALALANDPPVLLADEPTAELDSANEARLLDLLVGCARAGRAVVVASRTPAVIRRADRIITIVDGRVTS